MTGEFTGRKMAAVMVTFFAIVIGVNILLAVLASASWTGTIVKNSYVASQHFDEVTARLEKSAAMDVHSLLSYENGRIELSFRRSSGAAIPVRRAALKIGRPAHEGEDRLLPMTCNASGGCSATTALGPGVWSGEVDTEFTDNRTWIRKVSLFVKGD